LQARNVIALPVKLQSGTRFNTAHWMAAVNPEVVQFLLQVAGHLRPAKLFLGIKRCGGDAIVRGDATLSLLSWPNLMCPCRRLSHR